MRFDTIKIRKKSNGKIKIINAIDYATDLGQSRYAGYELVSEKRGDKPTETTKVKLASGITEVGVEEAMRADSGVRETEGYREVKRRRGRPRKEERANLTEHS